MKVILNFINQYPEVSYSVGAILLCIIILAIVLYIKHFITRRKTSTFATTTFIKKSFLKQTSTVGGEQLEMRAKDYDVNQTLDEIKQNILKITTQKNEIIEMVEMLKQKVINEEPKKLDEIQNTINNIQVRLVEIQAKTNHFCSPENIKRFEAELPKITAAPRIALAKDKGLASAVLLTEIMKSTEIDRKHYQHLLKIVKNMPREIKSFVAFIETQLKALERKLESFFDKVFKSVIGKEKLAHVKLEQEIKQKKPGKHGLEIFHKLLTRPKDKKPIEHASKKLSEHATTTEKQEPPRFKPK